MVMICGETLEGTIAEQRARLAQIEEDVRLQMETEIARIKDEKKLVWG